MSHNKLNLIGQRFGRWTVLSEASQTRPGSTRYLCRCDCGRESAVCTTNLRRGGSTQCYQCSRLSMTTHGESKRKRISRTYRIWNAMKQRCRNPINTNYVRYGGRGIDLCKEWETYETFLSDMGHCPKGFTLERINNESGYRKSNCRWATRLDQARNTSKTRYAFMDGKRVAISDISDLVGITSSYIRSHLTLNGMLIKNGHILLADWTISYPLSAAYKLL